MVCYERAKAPLPMLGITVCLSDGLCARIIVSVWVSRSECVVVACLSEQVCSFIWLTYASWEIPSLEDLV